MATSVYAKLFAVLNDIAEHGRIAKDKANTAQGYKYLSEMAVKELIQPLLVKHRLLFVPVRQAITSISEVKDSKQRVTDVSVYYRWIDVDTGAFVEGEFVGSGADSMDKGAYKALTGGGKQLMCNTFQIPTGDDPERDGGVDKKRVNRASDAPAATAGRSKQDPESVITEPQWKRLLALTHKVSMSGDDAKAIIARHGYKSSKDIKVKDYEAICKEIDPTA